MGVSKDQLEEMFATEDGDVLSFDPERSDVEDTADGGAIVKIAEDKAAVAAVQGFYENLASSIDMNTLSSLASEYIELIEQDIEDREPKDKQYEEAIKRTGMGDNAPGGAQFSGATRTAHPMISKAAIDFQSRAIKELFPPGGPVKSEIPGLASKERLEKAARKTRHMNWQLSQQIVGYRTHLEKLLSQLPMAGDQYERWTWDARYKRPSVKFVPIDKMIIPASAEDFYTAERRTFLDDMTEAEYDRRCRDGLYAEDDRVAMPSMAPTKSQSQEANQAIEGVDESPMNIDGMLRIYETEVELDLSEFDDKANGEPRPYIMRIREDTMKIVGLQRNWDKDDPTCENMTWNVQWGFIPWRGSHSVGIAQLIGGLSAAATGALRALLDSAHINNMPTLLKLKGAGFGGQTLNLEPTAVNDLEGTPGIDDIRKLVMAVPYNEPSLVLYQLMGFLVEEGANVVKTTFEDLAEQKREMPVGSTLALIEQGMAVMSAIHGRMYETMRRTLMVLHRLNKMYLTDQDVRDEAGDLLARASDYKGPMDVIPVADPRVFSEIQRYAQMQVIADRAEKRPQMYDQRKVEILILERLKFPNPEQLLTQSPEPQWMNAVNENVAATLRRPIVAFPGQDHLAHLQTHIEFLESPFLGALPPIMQNLIPLILPHLIEHVVLWYASRVFEYASEAVGADFDQMMKFKDEATRQEIDRTLAMAASEVIAEIPEIMQGIPPVIQKASEYIQQMQEAQRQAADPTTQAATTIEKTRQEASMQREQMRGEAEMQKTQLGLREKAEARQQTAQMRMEELRMRVVDNQQRQQTAQNAQTARIEAQRIASEARLQQSHERVAADLTMNTQDNATAMAIAEAEIESGEKTDVSTGAGINPGS